MIQIEPILSVPLKGAKPTLIAGPCSAETEEQVMATATALAAQGVRIFRAGIWKPRTKPGCFEGIGKEGLPWLQRVQRETGMLVTTEVANAHHVEAALKAGVDLLWIGARTTANPFAIQEIADALRGTDVPVLVKNPVNPDLELWMGALERFYNAGIHQLAAIHRGFSIYEKKIFRNPPQWQIPIELRRRLPKLPVLCDPSHMSGNRELVPLLCQQAMDLGFDGLMVEAHIHPEEAWSDAGQQVEPRRLKEIMDQLIVRREKPDELLFNAYRESIDRCDKGLIELLAERMRISREMGQVKKDKNIMILQPERYNEILKKRMALGTSMGVDEDCVRKIFETIHAESILQQLKTPEK